MSTTTYGEKKAAAGAIGGSRNTPEQMATRARNAKLGGRPLRYRVLRLSARTLDFQVRDTQTNGYLTPAALDAAGLQHLARWINKHLRGWRIVSLRGGMVEMSKGKGIKA